jgi:hypothetical protein
MNALHPLCAMLVLAGVAATQVQWLLLPQPVAPSLRLRPAVAYDAARDEVVLFGGVSPFPTATFADTWVFDGANWTQRNTPVAPLSRQWATMVYDSARQRLVMFGGYHWTGATWPWQMLGDTWEWDGTSWQQHTPATSPPARNQAGMTYDPVRERVVLFGGYFNNGSTILNYNDTWEWDGTTWIQLTPSTTTPSVRRGPLLFFDATRGHVMMTGGAFDLGTGNSAYKAETWEWDGSDWTQLAPPTDPAATNGESIVIDAARDRAVRYQGLANGQVYEWDGTDWIARSTAGSAPTDRMDFEMAYDSLRQRAVAFGGLSLLPPYSFLADTWSYEPVHHATIGSYGAGCAGTAGVPELAHEGLPWLGDTFRIGVGPVAGSAISVLALGLSQTVFGGQPLPLDLGPVGAPGCEVLAAPDVLAGPLLGASPHWDIAVPVAPSLIGFSMFVQGAVLDGAANPLGLVVSDAMAIVVGNR